MAADFTDRFTQHQQQEAWSSFIEQLKRKAQIEVNSELIGNSPDNS